MGEGFEQRAVRHPDAIRSGIAAKIPSVLVRRQYFTGQALRCILSEQHSAERDTFDQAYRDSSVELPTADTAAVARQPKPIEQPANPWAWTRRNGPPVPPGRSAPQRVTMLDLTSQRAQ